MKQLASIYWPVRVRVAPSSVGKRIVNGREEQTMQVIEKKVRVAVGLNEMARRLGCSRGHLSLVIHGRRKSGRLERRLKAMGFAVKEAV